MTAIAAVAITAQSSIVPVANFRLVQLIASNPYKN